MEVRLLDLKRQWATIREEVMAEVGAVFEDQAFVLGSRVSDLEGAVADYCGVRAAAGVASGTDALLLSLRALGVEKGEEVVTSPFTFFATAGAIWNAGGRPVFVDIDPATFNLDVERVEAVLTDRTRVLLPVHLFGQVADMDPLLELAEARGLSVLEDAAQAIGGEYCGKRAGRFGDLCAFSFFPSKNLGGAGDGGMVVGDDADLVERIRLLRGHGSRDRYVHEVVGWNSRLDALQAVVLKVKLRHLDGWTRARRAHAQVYDEAFTEMEEVAPPVTLDPCVSIYNQYTIRCRRRDELAAFLSDKGVGTAVYYPVPLHLQQCFGGLGYGEGDFPEAERASKEVLSLPVYPELTASEQAFVIESVKEFYRR